MDPKLSAPTPWGHRHQSLALCSEDKCRTPEPQTPSVAPGSGYSHVQSLDACRNRFRCWGHRRWSQALCPVHHTDTLQGRRPNTLWGAVAVLVLNWVESKKSRVKVSTGARARSTYAGSLQGRWH